MRRSFPADFVAAVVVKRSAEAPSPIESLDQLQSVAVYREAGEGRL